MDPRTHKRIVVPVYNEAQRLDTLAFDEALGADPYLSFVFVDDGSTDATRERICEWIDQRTVAGSGTDAGTLSDVPARVELIGLEQNAGKGEAVRHGLMHVLDSRKPPVDGARGADVVWTGYWDADLSADLGQIEPMAQLGDRAGADAVLGARARLLGHHIERSALRHYLGRVFATAAAVYLQTAVYDTQCGAKLLRVSSMLGEALATPFETRWIFDVELLRRLISRDARIVEFPLRHWVAVDGSKISPGSYARSGLDFARLLWKTRGVKDRQ